MTRLHVHRPLTLGSTAFADVVTRKAVRYARCRCGGRFLTDGGRWFGFKLRIGRSA